MLAAVSGCLAERVFSAFMLEHRSPLLRQVCCSNAYAHPRGSVRRANSFVVCWVQRL